jgi:hypothetical protein
MSLLLKQLPAHIFPTFPTPGLPPGQAAVEQIWLQSQLSLNARHLTGDGP